VAEDRYRRAISKCQQQSEGALVLREKNRKAAEYKARRIEFHD
jgi:hypothetical protein